MNLYQTSSGTLNNSYANESGQVIYKVSTPHKFSGRVTTTVSRIVPSDYEPPRVEDNEEVDFKDRFAPLGYIDWKTFVSSVMRYNGTEVKATKYLKKQGWGWYGRNRVFKGPDGKEYKWILRASPKLVLNDGSETLIAKFHTRNYGLFSPAKARPAYLEILPEGEHMVDVIFFTFIYVEKIRKEEERAAQSTAA
ncbi:hypothetical protein EV421DRAFT_1727059 [Armillaria borealis]|uniref:DUF6593 domain-containing protein n=1 Tax=Armillaria borealis TaxID=47425 RepID=A0AA39IDA2_9AGAR|nr:hypothetical protein EV421DRAFT_1727059 [Armillaria borealis]